MDDLKVIKDLYNAAMSDYKKKPKRMVLLHPNGKGKQHPINRMTLAAPRLVIKIGRNQPCPCRSGKKFKNCHGEINRVFPDYPEE